MCLSPRLAHLSSFFSSSFGSFIFLLYIRRPPISIFFFLNDTATPEIYPLPLHDALPISMGSDLFVYHGYADLSLEGRWVKATPAFNLALCTRFRVKPLEFDGRSDSIFHPFDADNRRHMEYLRDRVEGRSEEHTSELQSLAYLVCRLLLEKKKKQNVT